MPWYRINQHWKNPKIKRKEGIDYAYTYIYTLTVLAQLYVIHYATHTFNKFCFISLLIAKLSTGQFRSLQLIVLAAFGAVD